MQEIKELTVTEAMAWLVGHVLAEAPHRETMYEWLRDGRFPNARKAKSRGRGGSWRIPIGDLENFEPLTPGGRQGRPPKSMEEAI